MAIPSEYRCEGSATCYSLCPTLIVVGSLIPPPGLPKAKIKKENTNLAGLQQHYSRTLPHREAQVSGVGPRLFKSRHFRTMRVAVEAVCARVSMQQYNMTYGCYLISICSRYKLAQTTSGYGA